MRTCACADSSVHVLMYECAHMTAGACAVQKKGLELHSGVGHLRWVQELNSGPLED